jgi:hypothetical protein
MFRVSGLPIWRAIWAIGMLIRVNFEPSGKAGEKAASATTAPPERTSATFLSIVSWVSATSTSLCGLAARTGWSAIRTL